MGPAVPQSRPNTLHPTRLNWTVLPGTQPTSDMPVVICVRNDRPGGADLGRFPKQWLWESHQNGITSRVLNRVLNSQHTVVLLRWETWELPPQPQKNLGGFGRVWGSFAWGLTQPSARWFKHFTVKSHHTHIYLARILSCVLRKKRKNSNNAGNVPLVYPMSTYTQKCQKAQLCLQLAMHVRWKRLWVTVRVWSKKWNHCSWWRV